MRARPRLGLVLGVVLAACSGAGGVEESSSLDVLPRAAVVTAGEGTVTLTATVSGDVKVVSWTLAGVGSLAPAQGLTTVYTPPARVESDTDVTITARMSGLSRAVVVTVEPSPRAPVVGRVVRQSGQPVEGATVLILPDLLTTTDAAGAFTIPGVMVPYDVAVRAYHPVQLLLVQQLRRRDPTLLIDVGGVEDPPADRVAAASGQVSGGAGFPQPARHRTAVAIATPAFDEWYVRQGGVQQWGAAWADDLGAYGAVVPLTAAEADGTLHALQWRTDAAGLPVEYVASGARATHLVGGAAVDGQHLTLALTPDATTTLSGTFSFGGPAVHLGAWARLGGARVPIVGGFPSGTDAVVPAGPFELATPKAADAVEVTISTGSVWSAVFSGYNLGAFRTAPPGASGAELKLLAPPNPYLPPDGAILTSASTLFQWQLMGAPAPVYVVGVGGGSYQLRLITTASAVTIPDLSRLGVTIPRGETFSWFVYGTTAASTTDEACGPEGYLVRTSDYSWGRSIDLTFRTPP